MSSGRVVMLEVIERAGISGVTGDSGVQSVVVRAPGVDGIAIVEGVALRAALDISQHPGSEEQIIGQVWISVNACKAPKGRGSFGLGLEEVPDSLPQLLRCFVVVGNFCRVGQRRGKVIIKKHAKVKGPAQQ